MLINAALLAKSSACFVYSLERDEPVGAVFCFLERVSEMLIDCCHHHGLLSPTNLKPIPA